MCARRTPRLLARAGRAALLGVLACSSPDAGTVTDPPDPPDPDPPEEQGTLECEIEGYPCSLSEVEIAVLERSDSLGDEAVAMLDAGSSTAQVAAWLDGQAEMAEVESDDQAVRFRLDGGRGVWILREGAFGTGERSGPSASSAAAAATPGVAGVVVGPEVEEKKALVLSPFLWQFGANDEGAAVAGVLSATRGYEGGVTFLSNAEPTATDVALESFAGWESYQIIHVVTHGARICTDGGCRATLFAVTLEVGLPSGPASRGAKLAEVPHVGVEVAKSEIHGLDALVLTADFFRHQYPSGLENTLIFLNACESSGTQATDLVDAIRGTTSVVIGWDEPVASNEAAAAAVAMYDQLSEGGYPAEIAYEKLGNLKIGTAKVPGGKQPRLILSKRPAGGDLRIRDVVYVLHPRFEEVLTNGSRVGIEGTQGDGQPDAVRWAVRVDGVQPQFAANMIVRVTIDGVDAEPAALTTGDSNDQDQWTVRGILPLGYDLTEEKTVTFRASVNLHSGGDSEHEEAATLVGDEPLMGTEWEFVANEVNAWVGRPNTPWTASARLTLRFAPGQSHDEPHPRYVVTGGTVTYDYSHTYFDCTYTAPVLTYDVTEEHSGTSFLAFDTETPPVTYGGVIHTQGPSIVVTESCGDGSSQRSQVAANTWMLLDPGDFESVSADGRTITGTYRREQHFTGYYYYRESTYTITRIQ